MNPYKLLHKPTGLFFQPCKQNSSHLSKKGKIYQSNINGLSSSIRYKNTYPDNPQYQLFRITIKKDSNIHKLCEGKIDLQESKFSSNEMICFTNLNDWEMKPINENAPTIQFNNDIFEINKLGEKYNVKSINYIGSSNKIINNQFYCVFTYPDLEDLFKLGGDIYLMENNVNRGFSVR